MENYSLLMGAAAVMKMAVKMAAVSMEKPSGALPRLAACGERDSCPQILARDGGGSGRFRVPWLIRIETDDTSSGEVEEVVMPSTTLDLATSKSVDKAATLAKPSAETQEPITSSSAAPMVLGEGYDLSCLLTFDPESIEPAASKASEESGPSATHGQLQHLKALLSSSIETLVEDTEEVKSILEDIQPHLPVTLQRIGLRHAQLPLKADIADKCQRLNEKKVALDAKTDTSVNTDELETLQKELEDLEERVRVIKQLIQDKEALIAHSHEEAEGLKAELKTDLAEIRA
ncbi:hypothetical protein QYE76_044673 [Lolium multiflorum]|uniref:Uncharacterized protein n=1 Tax=Lolium multiflorum TaxID=4521 RepID=A0AAD8TJ21_LOLMU|nr:hypothetical protein QYE76_044673 [Lolium multiflorum]